MWIGLERHGDISDCGVSKRAPWIEGTANTRAFCSTLIGIPWDPKEA